MGRKMNITSSSPSCFSQFLILLCVLIPRCFSFSFTFAFIPLLCSSSCFNTLSLLLHKPTLPHLRLKPHFFSNNVLNIFSHRLSSTLTYLSFFHSPFDLLFLLYNFSFSCSLHTCFTHRDCLTVSTSPYGQKNESNLIFSKLFLTVPYPTLCSNPRLFLFHLRLYSSPVFVFMFNTLFLLLRKPSLRHLRLKPDSFSNNALRYFPLYST